MGLNKKGIFFTFMCFLLVLLIVVIFTTPRNLTLQYKQPVSQGREQTLNELYKTIDQAVIPEIMRISTIQALLAVTDKIKKDNSYLSSKLEGQFEDIVRGKKKEYSLGDNSIDKWQNKIANWVKEVYHLDDVELTLSTISISQKEPWFVEVTAQGVITLKDNANKIGWTTTKAYGISIPIEGLPDPLWAGKGVDVNITNMINATIKGSYQRNTTDIISWNKLPFQLYLKDIEKDERIQLLNASILQHAFFHPLTDLTAPSYLQRFEEGTKSDSNNGIFAFADMQLQRAMSSRNNPYHNSYVDYKFIGTITTANLDYLVGISDIDSRQQIFVSAPPPLHTEEHKFSIPSMVTDQTFKTATEKYRFKTDQKDKDYLSIGETSVFHCKDDISDNDPSPVFPVDNTQCYNVAGELAAMSPPKASVT